MKTPKKSIFMSSLCMSKITMNYFPSVSQHIKSFNETEEKSGTILIELLTITKIWSYIEQVAMLFVLMTILSVLVHIWTADEKYVSNKNKRQIHI